MKLTLRLTDHETDTGQSRTIETGTLSIGRGAANDWVLADPDRTLSKVHCRIDASEGGFMLTDLSTNGVFLAGSQQPVGRGHSVALEDGESFSIGPYRLHAEIAGGQDGLRLDQGLGLPRGEPDTIFPGGSGANPRISPLAPVIAEPWLANVPGGEFGPGRRAAPQGWEAPPDPATYAASGPFEQPATPGARGLAGTPFGAGSDLFSQTSEHIPAAATVMRVPESQVVLPSDWMDGDPMEPAPAAAAAWPPVLPEGPKPPEPPVLLPADWVTPEPAPEPSILPAGWEPASSPAPPTVSVLAPAIPPETKAPELPAVAPKSPPVAADPAPIKPAYVPASPRPAAPQLVAPQPVAPQSVAPQPVAPQPVAFAPDPTPAAAASAPVMPPASSPMLAPRRPAARPARVAPAPPPAPPPPPAPAAPSIEPVSADETLTPERLAHAFLEGAGLPPGTLEAVDAESAFYEIGQMVRAAVEGVRDILSTRALVKSEFRVDQTVLRRSDNNAVKFAPDVQRCLAAMVGAAPPGFLPGPAAMQQSMDDIKAHELALVAALNSVFADMGQQLDPDAIMRRARQDTGLSNMLPYAREAKCWAIYSETYRLLQDSGAPNTGGSLLAPLAQAYARQLRRGV